MTKDKIIVFVSQAFENSEALQLGLKKYAQYRDEQFAYWDEFAFTTSMPAACDAILVFNTVNEPVHARAYPEHVIAFMMEPGIGSEHPWMFRGLDQYYRVYSPIDQSRNTVRSHGFLGWHLKNDYDRLSHMRPPEKSKSMSCIASSLEQLKGHRLRLEFVNRLREELPQVDRFGKGINFIEDKMKGLLPYRYSIAIENTSLPDYFTEKINDCFLCYTVPVYYGCTNIADYFPSQSFISIDIREPMSAINQLKKIMETDNWDSRLAALQEARELVLKKYQPLAGASAIYREITTSHEKKMVTLKPVQHKLVRRIKTAIHKMIKPQLYRFSVNVRIGTG